MYDNTSFAEGDSNKSYKDKKGEKEKATAGHSYNWNTLFLGLNAVAEIMADTYNMSKQDVCSCLSLTHVAL